MLSVCPRYKGAVERSAVADGSEMAEFIPQILNYIIKSPRIPLYIFLALFGLELCQFLYNLLLHPLAGLPGSYLAAYSTEWYEWYWNVYKPGQLLYEIGRLHEKHGEIIRIGVNEVHINDPEHYIHVTTPSSHFLKDPKYYRAVGLPNAILALTDPEKHRIRKQIISPAFTGHNLQKIVMQVEHVFQRVQVKLKAYAVEERILNAHALSKAYAIDVISEIVLGQPFGALESPGFRHHQLDVMRDSIKGMWIPRVYPMLSRVLMNLPTCIARWILPAAMIEIAMTTKSGLGEYLRMRQEGKLRSLADNPDKDQSPNDESMRQESVVIERLLDPESAKDHQVIDLRTLQEEVLILLGAGNDTTSNALILGLYQLCKDRSVQSKLRQELKQSFPDASRITYERARRLPYLTAVLKEILRLCAPLPGRMPRVVPARGYEWKGCRLPAGVVVHSSAYLLNRHPAIWGPKADRFDPTKWLDPIQASVLDKYLASFYRGTRQCLGIKVAWCELYVAFATLFRSFQISVHRTVEEDMEWMDYGFLLFKGKELEVNLKLDE